MVSGDLTDDIRDECTKLGATDYLRKPIQMSKLKAGVRAEESMQPGWVTERS
jgi:DNA-binding response OmpR family regulator